VLTLLDEQARLERMARIIGKDALPARQRLTLANAELVNEAFLRQSPSPRRSLLRPGAAGQHAAHAGALHRAHRTALAEGATRRRSPPCAAAKAVAHGEEIDERDAAAMRAASRTEARSKRLSTNWPPRRVRDRRAPAG